MIETIKTLIRDNDICVLATVGAEGPHTSLMAYLCASDCTEIYLATSTNTLKYKNITANAQVSLLVDTRESAPRQTIQAVTIIGEAEEIADGAKKNLIQAQINQRRPHLQGLMSRPDIALIKVRITAFQLLSGVTDMHYVRL